MECQRLVNLVETPYSGPYRGREEISPADSRVVMKGEYMSQTEMVRTLESLVSAAEELKQSINWRLPLTMGLIIAILMALLAILVNAGS